MVAIVGTPLAVPILAPFLPDLLHVFHILRPGVPLLLIFLVSHFAPCAAALVKDCSDSFLALCNNRAWLAQSNRGPSDCSNIYPCNMMRVFVRRQHGVDRFAAPYGDRDD